MIAACPFPVAQGSQVYIKQMTEALVKRGHHLHLVCYHFGTYHEEYNFTIHRIPRLTTYSRYRAGPSLQKPFLDLMLSLKLWQVVKKEKIDIIHAHNYEAALAGLLVRTMTGIPVIFNSHNVLSDELYTYFRLPFTKSIAKTTAWLLDTYIPKKADYCITVSEESIKFLIRKGVPQERIKFIPPGINYSFRGIFNSQAIREKYHLGENSLIIYTGNLDGYQNIDFLFEVIKIVAHSLSNFTLVIITTSDYNHYQILARTMGIERYLIFIPHTTFTQVQEILAASTIAVSPRTSWSGFPIKLLNYMAAGKAIVAAEGSAKGIKHFHNGIIVNNDDSRGFAEAIVRLLRDPDLASRLGYNAKKDVITRYNWDYTSSLIEGVYEQVLSISSEQE